MIAELHERASKIQLLILDVDGVLTNGNFYLDAQAAEIKAFNTQDGLGITLLQSYGVSVAVISGRNSKAVDIRMQELSIEYVFQGKVNKIAVYEQLIQKLKIKDENVAYVGDDLQDLALIRRVGLGVAVANAVSAVKEVSHWQTTLKGGKGAVREVCDLILSAKGLLPDIVKKYTIGSHL